MTEPFLPPEGFTLDPLFSGIERPASIRRDKQRERRRRQMAFVPFADLPPREQRNRAVAMGWKIRNDRDSGGLFRTHDYLPGCKEWADLAETPTVHWADIYFMAQGRSPRIFFNATVHTLASRWAHALIEAVEADVDARMTEADQQVAFSRAYSRRTRHGWEMVFAPPPGLPSLDGLTLDGAKAARLREIWPERATRVIQAERAVLDRDYRYGIGLDLTVAEPNLSIQGVIRAIERFRTWGETDHVGPPEAFEAYQSQVDPILEHELWRWDCRQAEAEGRERPPAPADLASTDGFHSNAVRL